MSGCEIIIAIWLYGLGMMIMLGFGQLMASITGNSDWIGIGFFLGFFWVPIFAILYYIGKAIVIGLINLSKK